MLIFLFGFITTAIGIIAGMKMGPAITARMTPRKRSRAIPKGTEAKRRPGRPKKPQPPQDGQPGLGLS